MSTKPPAGLTLADLARYARLTAGIKNLTDEKNVLNAKIKLAYENAGVHGKQTFVYDSASGDVVVNIGEQHKVNTELLSEDFPLDQHPGYYKSTIDTSRIPADIVARYRTETSVTLSVSKAVKN